jgi:hypothetical protein
MDGKNRRKSKSEMKDSKEGFKGRNRRRIEGKN